MNKSLAKNYIYNTFYQVLSIIAPLITAPYVSRILHKEGVGLYSYLNSYTIVFSLLAGLGFSAYGQREIAYHQDDKSIRSKVFYEIMLFRSILTIVVSLLFVVFSFIYSDYTIYLLPQTFIILASVFEMSWYFQGLEEFKIIASRNAIVKIITVVCTFLFIRTENDLWIYVLIHSLSPLISNLLYLFIIKKYIVKIPYKELNPIRHLKGVIEFFLPLIAVQVYSFLDKIMLGIYMTTTEENGYYEQARKISTIVVTLVISLNTVMMSRISNLYAKKDREQIKKYYSKTFSIMLMLLFPICVGLFLVSDNFVIWYFSQEFSKVGILLKESSLLIVFMCIGNFVGVQFLSTTGRQNQMTIAYSIAALTNVLLNIVLIPRWLSEGALIASIVAEGVSCIIQFVLLQRSDYRFKIKLCIFKYILSSVVMAISIIFIHYSLRFSGAISTFIDVFVGVVVYVFVLIVLKEENLFELLRVVIKKK